MSGGHMAHLLLAGSPLELRHARLRSLCLSYRPQPHWRLIGGAGRSKPGVMTITATSTENRGNDQQEALALPQETHTYQAGWRKLTRASIKFKKSQKHAYAEEQNIPDQGARIQGAAGNGAVMLPDVPSRDENKNNLFQLCCTGAAVVMGLLFATMMLKKVGSQSPQVWGLTSNAILGTIKLLPSMVEQALSQGTGYSGDSFTTRPQQLRLNVTPPNVTIMNWSPARLSYMLDVLLERHPFSYVFLLIMACLTLIGIGGVFFHKYRSKQSLGDSLWDAWACLCASGTHLKEKTRQERTIGIFLAFGGLLFYSLLTSTMTAQIKLRMEWLREGAHSQVMESGHVIICGANNHITTVLQQLNKSQEFAIRDGTAASRYTPVIQNNSLCPTYLGVVYDASTIRKQTVLLLSERTRRETEKLVSPVTKDCTEINILTRCGSLSSTRSFQKVAADKARSIVLLANKDDAYEADADSVLAVLALQSLLDEQTAGNVIVEVSKKSTADLLKSLTGLKVSPVQNLSSKLFVQCARQCGLVDVYHQLLDHGKTVINLRNYPALAGLLYGDVRRGFPEAVICGLIPAGGGPEFHPKDNRPLEKTDKLLVIARKHTHRVPPSALVAKAEENQRIIRNPMASSSQPSNAFREFLGSKTPNIFSRRVAKPASKTADWSVTRKERIIILGWRPGVSEMVWEYDDYVGPGSELVILAEAPVDERVACLARRNQKPLRNIHVIHKIGNPMSRTDLQYAILESSPLKSGAKTLDKSVLEDHDKTPLSIVVIGDQGWHAGDSTKPDKQCVFALLLAESLCKEHNVKVTSLVAEFVDTKLGKQVVKSHPSLTYIGTSVLTGLVTSQVMEHWELNAVWTELLNSWGNEIYMKGIQLYMEEGESPSFAELAERAVLRDEVAIGYRHSNKVMLNPSSKDEPLDLSPEDSLVVISEFE